MLIKLLQIIEITVCISHICSDSVRALAVLYCWVQSQLCCCSMFQFR